MESFKKNGLEEELMELIVRACNILDPIPADFSPTDPLIGSESPLGLDSLDAVELVVAIEKQYNIRIGSEAISRSIFRSLKTLSDFVRKQTGAIQQ